MPAGRCHQCKRTRGHRSGLSTSVYSTCRSDQSLLSSHTGEVQPKTEELCRLHATERFVQNYNTSLQPLVYSVSIYPPSIVLELGRTRTRLSRAAVVVKRPSQKARRGQEKAQLKRTLRRSVQHPSRLVKPAGGSKACQDIPRVLAQQLHTHCAVDRCLRARTRESRQGLPACNSLP